MNLAAKFLLWEKTLVGLFGVKGNAVRYKAIKIFFLIILWMSVEAKALEPSFEQWGREQAESAGSYKLDESLIPDIAKILTTEDKTWMKQQIENLKNIKAI